MKFKYDLTSNFFKCLDITYGIAIRRRRIKKYEGKKVSGYLRSGLLLLGICFCLFLYMIVLTLMGISKLLFDIMTWGFFISLWLLAVYYINIFLNFLFSKKQSYQGVLSVDENGICDTIDSQTSTCFAWTAVENIVVKKNVVVIFAKYPVLLFAFVKHPKKFVEEVKKYTDRIVVVK